MHQMKENRHQVAKLWGHEDWIVNKDLYCGKKLTVHAGRQCSWHFHRVKDETFYLQSGHLILRYGHSDDIGLAETIDLFPGDSFYVPVGLRHQFKGVIHSELFEFSTTHFDEDTTRILPGE